MKRNLVILASSFSFLLFSQFSCDEIIPKKEKEVATPECSIVVTVRLSPDLDGCNVLLEKEDGTYLEPWLYLFCGTPPLPPEAIGNVLLGFDLKDGQVLKIGYEELDSTFSA